VFTHEQGPTRAAPTAEAQLRRTLMACLLFEGNFYEDGQKVADRLREQTLATPFPTVLALAREARLQMNLRHAPLAVLTAALDHPRRSAHKADLVGTIAAVCKRPDDLGELLALYWVNGRKPIAAALKEGLAKAFTQFDAYQLAKYQARGAIRLRDVLFMVHAKPVDEAQAQAWALLADDKLVGADTWETALSAGANKASTFERLLSENKLGGLATLRNLRNMGEAGVPKAVVAQALLRQAGRSGILPFQYVSAALAYPRWEDIVEPALLAATTDLPRLKGKTVLLVDTSGSMKDPLSSKSVLQRDAAAAALAMLLREVCEEVEIATFDSEVREMPPRRGFALRDLLKARNASTDLGKGVVWANARGADRIVVITDEQSQTAVGAPKGRGYIMNVASHEHGVGYGAWTHVSGFSENLVRFITEREAAKEPA
jgi:hypothetical protein